MNKDSPAIPSPRVNKRKGAAAAFGVGLVAFVLYALTAQRTIVWWDNPEYITAAATLGIAHPPGSLLLVLSGWVVSKLSFGLSTAFALNLFSGLMAAATVGLVGCTVPTLVRAPLGRVPQDNWRAITASTVGIAAGALLFCLSETQWYYATRITPYTMTVLFTALILLAMARWWAAADSPGARKWIFVVALLIGLDLSVHRTNLLLLPGLAVWIVLRRPSTVLSLRCWLYGIGGLAVGAAFHLLLIPMALQKPFLNWGHPSNLSRFWDYVSLEQYGGGWLVNIYPRKAPFWGYQVADYLRVFRNNFLSFDGVLGVIGFIPLLLGVMGIVSFWKRDRRMTLGLGLLFVITAFATILYFNLPADFFRSIDRHYLPSFVIWGVAMAAGAGYAFQQAAMARRRWRVLAVLAAAILILLGVASQFTRNYRNVDSSHTCFAYDYAGNTLRYVADDAILFTYSDIDTFPLWYLQKVEGVRPDVTICCKTLLNTNWHLLDILANDDRLPISLTKVEIENLQPEFWNSKATSIPVDENPGAYPLPDHAALPDTVFVQIPVDSAGWVFISDQVVTHLIAENQWRRPVYFTTVTPLGQLRPWERHLRLEGTVYQLMPIDSVAVDADLLQTNLTERYTYRGFNDPSVPVDIQTRRMAKSVYWNSFLSLANQLEISDPKECEEVVDYLIETLPPDRLGISPDLQKNAEEACNR